MFHQLQQYDIVVNFNHLKTNITLNSIQKFDSDRALNTIHLSSMNRLGAVK